MEMVGGKEGGAHFGEGAGGGWVGHCGLLVQDLCWNEAIVVFAA